MKNKSLLILLASAAILSYGTKALAICPVCTVAVGAGIGLSRWLGIDDSDHRIVAGRILAFDKLVDN